MGEVDNQPSEALPIWDTSFSHREWRVPGNIQSRQRPPPSVIGSRLGRNRLWVRFLAVSDNISHVHWAYDYSGSFGDPGYIWLDTKIVLKSVGFKFLLATSDHTKWGGGQTTFSNFFLWWKKFLVNKSKRAWPNTINTPLVLDNAHFLLYTDTMRKLLIRGNTGTSFGVRMSFLTPTSSV